MIIPGKKVKISLNIDKNVLIRLDDEIKNYFKNDYNRLQRSRMIEHILLRFLDRMQKKQP
jgi:metal-responsive CopG/Arc/MetJ family transcriptional regulator